MSVSLQVSQRFFFSARGDGWGGGLITSRAYLWKAYFKEQGYYIPPTKRAIGHSRSFMFPHTPQIQSPQKKKFKNCLWHIQIFTVTVKWFEKEFTKDQNCHLNIATFVKCKWVFHTICWLFTNMRHRTKAAQTIWTSYMYYSFS